MPATAPAALVDPNPAAFATAVDAAGARGTPVHRTNGAQVSGAIASVLCFPGDFLHVQAEVFDRGADGCTNVVTDAWRAGGGSRVLAVVYAAFLGPLIALCYLLALLSRMFATPFDVARIGFDALGAAATHERRAAPELANYRRIDPRDWPRLPENAAADAAVSRYVHRTGEFAGRAYETDVLVVPGYASESTAVQLHPRAIQRAQMAAADFLAGRAPFILVSGGNVHPSGTPYNEATELRRYLIETLHVPADRVIMDPLAAHSPTNVRNAGRYMLSMGLHRAEIVSDDELFGQPMMFNASAAPFFGVAFRSLWENGVSFGTYRRVDSAHTLYSPSRDVMLVRSSGDDR